MAEVMRDTGETEIRVRIARGEGLASAHISDGFLRHVVEILARYSGLDITVEATGDLRHHLVEDVGITLGLALQQEVPETAARYGWCVLPMDEALVEAAVDLGGRAHFEGELPAPLYTHFFRSFAMNLGATLHLRVLRGGDRHHVIEAAVKATGMALRQALADGGSVFSTKGSVRLRMDG